MANANIKKLSKKNPRIEIVSNRERLYLRNYSDVVVVVAAGGHEERKICDLDEYNKGLVKVQRENGKPVTLTLQSVSR